MTRLEEQRAAYDLVTMAQAAAFYDAKGWTIREETDPEVCGVPRMVDPVDGREYSPYEAEKIQYQRENPEGG